jgi:hypothetical protein
MARDHSTHTNWHSSGLIILTFATSSGENACRLDVPLIAAGTGALMLVEEQAVGVAVMPLKVTVIVPWLAPKLRPLSVTTVATAPPNSEGLVNEEGPAAPPTSSTASSIVITAPTLATTGNVVVTGGGLASYALT